MRETLLPYDHQIAYHVEQTKNNLLPYLAGYAMVNNTFVDKIFENQVGEDITKCTKFLSQTLYGDHDTAQTQDIAHHAFFFAYQASLHATGGAVAPVADIGSYNRSVSERLKDTPAEATTREALRSIYMADSDEYFEKNPAVEHLVQSHVNTIDPSGEHRDLAFIVAGLTFLQIELGAEKAYIQMHVDLFEQEMGES